MKKFTVIIVLILICLNANSQKFKLATQEISISKDDDTAYIEYTITDTKVGFKNTLLNIKAKNSDDAIADQDYSLIDLTGHYCLDVKYTVGVKGKIPIYIKTKVKKTLILEISFCDFPDEKKTYPIFVNQSIKSKVEATKSYFKVHTNRRYIPVYQNGKRLMVKRRKPLYLEVAKSHIVNGKTENKYDITVQIKDNDNSIYFIQDIELKVIWSNADVIYLDGDSNKRYILLKDLLDVEYTGELNEGISIDEDSDDIKIIPKKNKTEMPKGAIQKEPIKQP